MLSTNMIRLCDDSEGIKNKNTATDLDESKITLDIR